MIVVAIIGILAAIAVPLYANMQARARVAKAQADIRGMASAVVAWSAHMGALPSALVVLTGIATSPQNITAGPFMAAIPTPPSTAWGAAYSYTTNRPVHDLGRWRRRDRLCAVVAGGRGMPITTSQPSAGPMPRLAPNVRVLIAEDERNVRDLLCAVLRGHEFTVMAVADGAQAIRAFRNHDFDVVLTDLTMPGYSGLQVAQTVKRQRPSVKVVMLTAWDLLLDDEDCIHHGVDRLIPKPVEMTTVVEALHQVRNTARFERSVRTSA